MGMPAKRSPLSSPWWAHAALAWPLAKKDVLARYRGSAIGLAWALLTPLAMVVIYALVFRGVFQARWAQPVDVAAAAGAAGAAGAAVAAGAEVAIDGVGYAVRLFAGLMVFTGVAEVASRATRLMTDNANLVKRVLFPLELLCLALVLQTALHAGLQTAVLAAVLLLTGEWPRWQWLALPLVWAWVFALQLALAWWLSALGCYLRDLQHLVPAVLGGLLFLSPVFYPLDAAPPILRGVLLINPLTGPIEAMRWAWFGGALRWDALAISLIELAVLLPVGRWIFARLRPGFADLV